MGVTKEVLVSNNYWQERAVSEVRLICGYNISVVEFDQLLNNYKEEISKSNLANIAYSKFNQFFKDKHLDGKDPDSESKRMSIMQCLEIFGDLEAGYSSYGIFIPSYLEALHDFNKTVSHDSILVGALNMNTVKEYNYLMGSVFSQRISFIMDKDPSSEVRRYKYFMKKDILEMPFTSNSFDSIQTNFLINEIPREAHTTIFNNALRVLKPNGKLIMVEKTKDIDFNQLAEISFRKIEIKDAGFINKRRDLVMLLEKKLSNDIIDNNICFISKPGISLVMATK
jgi:hypothetical protein